jgi:DNA repair protein SbcC/Rad50
MRPLRLRVKGFTAFRDEQELDFTDLDLFVIWGPTGSGKSSLLDAMTYALYGKAERLEGAQVARTELISHGQPRMTASLEFEAGGDTLRVSRSTPRTGSTTARLDVLDGCEWRSYGVGADQVRQVNRLIAEKIGLDYKAFTRSVILPQGKFAEFLMGEAKDRRAILTELLGLELFGVMGARAAQISDAAGSIADANQHLIDGQFNGINDIVVKAAEKEARAARRAAKQAAEAEARIESLRERALQINCETEELARHISVTTEVSESFGVHQARALELVDQQKRAEHSLKSAKGLAKSNASALQTLERRFIQAEKKSGSREELLAHRGRLQRVQEAIEESETAEKLAAEASDELARAKELESVARAAHAKAESNEKNAARLLDDAQQRVQNAQRRDMVGALVEGLHIGEPCPVCERSLDRLPRVTTTGLKDATSLADKHVNALASAQASVRSALSVAATAGARLESATKESRRYKAEARRWAGTLEDRRSELTAAFGGLLPLDPDKEIDLRLETLDRLSCEIDEIKAKTKDSELKVAESTRELEDALNASRQLGTAMEHSRQSRQLTAAVALAPSLHLPHITFAGEDPAVLARAAAALIEYTSKLRSALGDKETSLSDERASIAAEAQTVLSLESAPELNEMGSMMSSARELCRTTRDAATLAEATLATLKEDLKRRQALEEEARTKRGEQQLYAALRQELRNDQIIDYLQSEALSALASSGSDRLLELSSQRYRLAYEHDEFFVVDSWNGDERRNARTLSGGETFLASLALSLALADQVQLLAVTEKGRMASLFLDEGFGSLDADALGVVVDAIERLGGEDRLVGVITHVTELADRLPSRIEIEKSPRGSRLQHSGAASNASLSSVVS